MQLPVMRPTERYGELIANLHPKRSGLGETQVMRIGGLTSADKTGLRCDELQMCLVTQPFGLGDGEVAFVNPTRNGIEPVRDKWRRRRLFLLGCVVSQLVQQRRIVAAAVIARWPWNRRCIIGMKSKALYGLRLIRWDGHGWLD